MIKLFISCVSFLLLGVSPIFAQSKKILNNQELLKTYLNQSVFDIDTQANAVILFEETTCNYGNGSYDYTYEIIAKVLHKAAIDDLSLINIYKRDNTTFLNASGETYNLENGNITITKLEKSDIIKDRLDEDFKLTKFIIPNVKEGSIIHYQYKIHKTDVAKIPDWSFQSKYPTLVSKYALRLPKNLSCNKIMRSRRHFTEVTSERILDTCDACEFSPQYESEARLISWSIRNVPGFNEEPFSSSPDNFKERLRVMITDFYLNSGGKRQLYNSWDDYSKEYLFKNDNFIGQAFSSNGFLDETVAQLTAGMNNDLEKAKAIYKYVQQHFATVDVDNDEENIKTVLKNKKGDLYGINLLLIALLKKANLNCDPIILSTKKNERFNKDYPNPYSINYLVGILKDNDKTYYLDAAALLPFGTLMPECYNGYARIVNKKGAAIILSPDSIIDKSLTIVNITPSDNQNELHIKVQRNLGVYGSVAYRNKWRKDLSGAKKAIEHVASVNNIKLIPESVDIDNIDNPEEKIQIVYEAKMAMPGDAATIYFNPYFYQLFEQNPFTATSRNLPIEMDYKESWTYVLNFKLPAGYEPDDFPKSTIVKLNAEGNMVFSNILGYEKEDHSFNIKSSYSTKTSFFSADDYQNIRSLYMKIVEEQNKKIVLTKTQP